MPELAFVKNNTSTISISAKQTYTKTLH